MLSIDHELDSIAQSNSVNFWKTIKKRKAKQQSFSAGVEFDGVKARDPDRIRDGCANYFERLYTPSDKDFDTEWKDMVESNLHDCFNNMVIDHETTMESQQVEESIKSLPKGKAGGVDGLQYEHLIYAYRPLSVSLANSFSSMFRASYVLNDLKRGVISTLHKGGNTRRDNPDNYRAITLSSVVFKVFEDIVLRRSQVDILKRINKQQGGFQDGLSYTMTSFLIRETIHFANENSSKLYVAFMDGKKAFAVVWHDGLLY